MSKELTLSVVIFGVYWFWHALFIVIGEEALIDKVNILEERFTSIENLINTLKKKINMKKLEFKKTN